MVTRVRRPSPAAASLYRNSSTSTSTVRGTRIGMFCGSYKDIAWTIFIFLGVGFLLVEQLSMRSSSADSDSLLLWKGQEQSSAVPIDVCFVSSIYATSTGSGDKPGDFRDFKPTGDSTFAFFLYTNLEDLEAPGWHKIIKEFHYRRYITQSRWGKFMGWKDPELQGCKTIFYFDGHFGPNDARPSDYLEMAAAIRQSDVGLAQVRHPVPERTPFQEFRAILQLEKDIPTNVEASVNWLEAQPDFFNNCTMYANYYFGTSFFFVGRRCGSSMLRAGGALSNPHVLPSFICSFVCYRLRPNQC
jgi:hypothetical protein